MGESGAPARPPKSITHDPICVDGTELGQEIGTDGVEQTGCLHDACALVHQEPVNPVVDSGSSFGVDDEEKR